MVFLPLVVGFLLWGLTDRSSLGRGGWSLDWALVGWRITSTFGRKSSSSTASVPRCFCPDVEDREKKENGGVCYPHILLLLWSGVVYSVAVVMDVKGRALVCIPLLYPSRLDGVVCVGGLIGGHSETPFI